MLVAAAFRLDVLRTLYDVPGDGPSRASLAIAWAAAPSVPRCGGWPPGWTFLAGTFSTLVGAPLWSSRILNATLGTLSVAILWSIAARTWGALVALPVALALALFPLHAELSATSLSEVSFVFALLLGWRLLLGAVRDDGSVRRMALVAGGLCVSLAQMVRYEGWLFAAPILAWWFVARGRSRALGALAVLVLWFPATWMVANARCGDAIMGFRAAVSEPSAGVGYGLTAALGHLAKLVLVELGVVGTVALAAGIAAELVSAARRRTSAARVLALCMAATAWVFLLRFTMSRGPSAWNRYALMTLVVSLPFAFVTLKPLWHVTDGRRVASVVALVLLLGIALPDLAGLRARHWLRATPPVEAERFARWLEGWGERARVPILATPVGWELTYLGFYLPDVEPRMRTISGWISSADLTATLDGLRGTGPFLLVTRDGDEADLARIQHTAGAPLITAPPVYETAALRVYVAQLAPRGDGRESGR